MTAPDAETAKPEESGEAADGSAAPLRFGDESSRAGLRPEIRPELHIETLRKRSDFLAAARARRWAAAGLVLQGRKRRPDECETGGDLIRVGYTCSKKVGNAVARNRAKRRLRAAAAQVTPIRGLPGWDYVLIGRANATASRPFALLLDDLETGLRKVHAPKPPKARAKPQPKTSPKTSQ